MDWTTLFWIVLGVVVIFIMIRGCGGMMRGGCMGGGCGAHPRRPPTAGEPAPQTAKPPRRHG